MKVKIGDRIFSSDEHPIMIILTDFNKEQLRNISEADHKYCEFPEHMTEQEIKKWMKK